MNNERPVFTVTMPNDLRHIVEADTPSAAMREVSRIFGTPEHLLKCGPFSPTIIAPAGE